MSTVSPPAFEVRDNPLSAAKGHKLLTLCRKDDLTTYVVVTDGNEQTVSLRIEAGTAFARSTTNLPLTVAEARALASMLLDVAEFIEAHTCTVCGAAATLTAQRRWPEGAVDSQRLGFCEAHATSDLAFPVVAAK